MRLHNTKQMLLDAQAGHYAVPAFNIHNLETLSTVVETAAEMSSPVIIAATPSTVAYAGKDYLIALVGAAMEKYDIPMSFHLDHHEDVADIEDTVAAGCRSVMIDASKLPYEENVKKFAHAVKAFFKEHPEANDPRKYMTPGKQAMKEVVIHKIKVCGSEGRA